MHIISIPAVISIYVKTMSGGEQTAGEGGGAVLREGRICERHRSERRALAVLHAHGKISLPFVCRRQAEYVHNKLAAGADIR